MVVCVECLPADKPWDVVSVTRRSSGVAPRACVRVYARVLVPPNLYIHACIETRKLRPLRRSQYVFMYAYANNRRHQFTIHMWTVFLACLGLIRGGDLHASATSAASCT